MVILWLRIVVRHLLRAYLVLWVRLVNWFVVLATSGVPNVEVKQAIRPSVLSFLASAPAAVTRLFFFCCWRG